MTFAGTTYEVDVLPRGYMTSVVFTLLNNTPSTDSRLVLPASTTIEVSELANA
jgi:hypothetical protein